MKKSFIGMLAIVLLISFCGPVMAAADDNNQNQKVVIKKNMPDKKVINKTLNKIPAPKKNINKEKIAIRPAAVTRADKKSQEKLPLVWKLESTATVKKTDIIETDTAKKD